MTEPKSVVLPITPRGKPGRKTSEESGIRKSLPKEKFDGAPLPVLALAANPPDRIDEARAERHEGQEGREKDAEEGGSVSLGISEGKGWEGMGEGHGEGDDPEEPAPAVEAPPEVVSREPPEPCPQGEEVEENEDAEENPDRDRLRPRVRLEQSIPPMMADEPDEQARDHGTDGSRTEGGTVEGVAIGKNLPVWVREREEDGPSEEVVEREQEDGERQGRAEGSLPAVCTLREVGPPDPLAEVGGEDRGREGWEVDAGSEG